MGDKYPPEGADLKESIQLHLYKEATLREGEPLNVELIHEGEMNGKNYEFRMATKEEAENLLTQLNIHIQYAKWLQRNPHAAFVDGRSVENSNDRNNGLQNAILQNEDEEDSIYDYNL